MAEDNGTTKKDALIAAFKAAIMGQIGDNPRHGWGAEDSAAVVDAIVAEDATLAAKEEGMTLEKYSLSEDASVLIKKVINPSQFRQFLEGQRRPDGKPLLITSESKRQKLEIGNWS
jgi:hypothetical protein